MAFYEIDNRAVPIDFSCGSGEMVRRTVQNAKNLLMTRMGEVPYDRLRGFDQRLLDLPMNKLREALLPELDRLMMWEPDAEVHDAEAYLDENGELVIRVILKIEVKE